MSRIFSKHNSSPALPVAPIAPKSPAMQRPHMGVAVMPVGFAKKAAAVAIAKESPPPSPKETSRETRPSPILSKRVTLKQLPVFGTPLESLLAYDSRDNDDQVVPFLIEECIVYLNKDDILKSEGLFRQSGKSTEIQDVKRSYDSGKYITLAKTGDPHVVTGLLKLYLRSLPEPVIPFAAYESFIAYQKNTPGDIDQFRKLIETLPFKNKVLLKFLCLLLKRAATFEKQSKMNYNSLSIVIGPNIMRSEHVDMMKAMEESPLINYLTATMIEYANELFNSADLSSFDLDFFTFKRKRRPPVYTSLQEYQVKLEERKKTRSFLAAFFQRRPKTEDLVKKKILTDQV